MGKKRIMIRSVTLVDTLITGTPITREPEKYVIDRSFGKDSPRLDRSFINQIRGPIEVLFHESDGWFLPLSEPGVEITPKDRRGITRKCIDNGFYLVKSYAPKASVPTGPIGPILKVNRDKSNRP